MRGVLPLFIGLGETVDHKNIIKVINIACAVGGYACSVSIVGFVNCSVVMLGESVMGLICVLRRGVIGSYV